MTDNNKIQANLTEQWKKGELPEDLYYVENNEGNIGILGWSKFAGWYNIKQVLAPVPNYDEWQDLKSRLQLKETAYDFDTARLEEQNAQLKELLKECREPLEVFADKKDACEWYPEDLLAKINEALK